MRECSEGEELVDSLSPQSHFLSERSPTGYFLNHFCTSFTPLQEFFAAQQPLVVRKPRPFYTQTCSTNYRNNLKPNRQIQYLRRVVNHDYSDVATKSILMEHAYKPFEKLGNGSVYLEGWLYWAQGTKILGFDPAATINCEQPGKINAVQLNNAQQIIDTHEGILELKVVGAQLLARSSRKVFVLGPRDPEDSLQIFQFDEEIIAVWPHVLNESKTLQVSTFDGEMSRLLQVDLAAKTITKRFEQSSLVPIHSVWNLTRNESILCDHGRISVYDARMKKLQKLLQIDTKTNRIFSGRPLDLPPLGHCLALSQSFVVGVFDLRKPSEPHAQLPHYCQQSPPTILQIFDPLQQHDEQTVAKRLLSSQEREAPILVAHSPYALGSALYVELEEENLISYNSIPPPSFGFQMLFDRGKLDYHFYPRSITGLKINEFMCFFHIDNMEGMTLEVFRNEIKGRTGLGSKKTQAKALGNQLQRFKVGKSSELEDTANSQWFRRHVLEKYVGPRQDRYWQEHLLDDDMSLEIEDNKLQQRYLRYADLKQFYHVLLAKAKENKASHAVQQENQKISAFLRTQGQEAPLCLSSLQTTLGSSYAQEEANNFAHGEQLSLAQLVELHEDWQKD